jgi:hypothetical protein
VPGVSDGLAAQPASTKKSTIAAANLMDVVDRFDMVILLALVIGGSGGRGGRSQNRRWFDQAACWR